MDDSAAGDRAHRVVRDDESVPNGERRAAQGNASTTTGTRDAVDRAAPSERLATTHARRGLETAPRDGDTAERSASRPASIPSGDQRAGGGEDRTPAASADTASAEQDSAGADAETLAFEAAHRAHFGGGEPVAALRAWDAYLGAYPRGRYELEARYNRALCLIRLGRHAAARDALRAFADGAHGGYRRAEARALVDALSARIDAAR